MTLLAPGVINGAPNVSLGKYLTHLLENWGWVIRRVEHVQLIDARVTKRHVTVDVDTNAIGMASNGVGADASMIDPGVLMDPSVVPVPVAILTKDLLMDFDIRDAQGQALAIPSREEDSFAAASVMAYGLKRFLSPAALAEVGPRLFEIAHSFPLSKKDVDEWRLLDPSPRWSDSTAREWNEKVLSNDKPTLLVKDFAYRFLLLTQMHPGEGTELLKFSYQGRVDWDPGPLAKLGVVPSKAHIVVPGVIQTRSYHLRFTAPEGLVITGAQLAHRPAKKRPPADWRAHRKQNLTEVYLYASRLFPLPSFVAEFSLRAPTNGFVRTATASTLLTALTLVFVLVHYSEFDLLSVHQGDAVVTLLLVVPLVLGAYVVRPREHTMVNTLLRRTRFLVAGAALLPYIVAIALLPRFEGWPARFTIRGAVAACTMIALLLIVVSIRTANDIRRAGEAKGRIERVEIPEVDLPGVP